MTSCACLTSSGRFDFDAFRLVCLPQRVDLLEDALPIVDVTTFAVHNGPGCRQRHLLLSTVLQSARAVCSAAASVQTGLGVGRNLQATAFN